MGATERVFLIGAQLSKRTGADLTETMAELAELARTAGAKIIGEGTQRLDRPHAATYIGKGKANEFAEICKQGDVDTVIFDDELSPAQTRNLEGVFDCKVLDRTALILDIFAQRARTREGKMQIEMAQLQHILPRLTGLWTHLSRQKGGIGMRGDGESQLEVDRRRIQDRISKLRRDLKEVKRVRSTQRQGRQRSQWPLASIVGYTNAGKSTLLNALTGAEVLAEDKLFATLDPTTRRITLPTNQNALLSDTVGFIRKLPHQLVESFKATLEEVVEADLLLHVVDVASETAADQIASVNEVLEEIAADDKPTLMVFNKIDQLPERNGNLHWLCEYPHAVCVSAKTGEGLDELQAELGMMLRPVRSCLELQVPASDGATLARIRALGQVDEERYEGDIVHLKARIPDHAREEFSKFIK
ncbi:MAG TPA: GTPase HflX [Verrucomicrobiales bacterium]|nr:GTPase HflX [Verrucomicrobiales bacterium]HIL23881.1 GTPase HflX [Verrucomicrobiota bacterium]